MREPNRLLWVAPLGVAIVCLFLLPALATFPIAVHTLLTLVALATLMAIFGFVQGRWKGFRGRYDLDLLREVHEQKELEEIDAGFVSDEADEILCVHCFRPYKNRLPVCPHCNRVIGIN